MKITVSYTPEETRLAESALKLLRGLLPDAVLRSSVSNPPRKILYLTTAKTKKH